MRGRGHLVVCAECCAFVERLTVFAQGAQPAALDIDARIARAIASAATPGAAGSVGVAESAGSSGREVRDIRSAPSAKRARLVSATGMIAPLVAAAAIVFFFVRTRPDVDVGRPLAASSSSAAPLAPTAPDRVLMGEVPTAAGHDPDTTFKGGLQLAVVRERHGAQLRFAVPTELRVRAGDRLRVEVALDREEAILGGVLADDGSFLELMPLAVRGPGTHFSERSAKIDAAPSSGTIVIGTPEAIARVRATQQVAGVAGVASLRVEWEGTP